MNFRGEHGAGDAISTFAGALLFLVASMSVAGFLIQSVGASSAAQANTELTAAIQTDLQQWQATPWGELPPESQTTQTSLTVAGRSYPAIAEVAYIPALHSYQKTIAASRLGQPGATLTDCSNALTSKVPGCLAISATIVATADDERPALPNGVTLNKARIAAAGRTTNLLPNPGFESTTLAPWANTGTGTAAVVVAPARASGTRSLNLIGKGSQTTSATLPANAGDTFRFSAFALGDSGGSVILGYIATLTDGSTVSEQVDTATPNSAWSALAGIVSAPPGTTAIAMTLAAADGTQLCSASCVWALDDATVSVIGRNMLGDPGFESGAWTLTAQATVEPANNRMFGDELLVLTGATAATTSSAIGGSDLYYQAEIWVQNLGGSQTGTVIVSTADGTAISSTPLSSISTGWTLMHGEVTLPAGTVDRRLVISVEGAGPSSVIHADDAVFRPIVDLAANAATDEYVKLADIDSAVLEPARFAGQISLRVSFQYLGAAPGPTDMRAAVFCTTDPNALAVADAAMAALPDSSATGTWYWSRIVLPNLTRLQDCANPDLRVYSTSGATPDLSAIGDVFVLKVLSGITGVNHEAVTP